MLRASGVNYDIRKVDRYGIYDRFNFRVPLGSHGDVYDRYMVRVLEMHESVGILRDALAQIPAGAIVDPKAKIRGFRPKAGESYGRIEAPKGELGFYVVSNGKANPYRYHVRAGDFVNLGAIEQLAVGHKIGDLVAIVGAVDIIMGSVDR